MNLPDVSGRWGRWAVGAAGLLVPLAFAPFGWYPLAVPVTAVFMLLCHECSPAEAARRGFWFGFAAFAAGAWWLYTSIHGFGGAPVIVAVVLMLALFCLMASYYALTAAAAGLIAPADPFVRWCVLWPALFTVFEWLRGVLFTGFPWLTFGYSQIDGPLGHWAPVTGVHGLSWLTLLLSGALLTLVFAERRGKLGAAVLITVIGFATLAVRTLDWTAPDGDVIRVSMIQGSIPQDLKWRLDQMTPTMRLYRDLTFEQEADLVIWPEAAVPAIDVQVRDYLDEVSETARQRDLQIYLGILTLDPLTGRYRNSLIGLGRYEDEYHKRHLVPFGEFFPVPDFARKWMRSAGLPNEDTLPGDDDQSPLRFNDVQIAPTICYEDAYGAEQLVFLPQADLLINVSNDAWFGDSIAPHQHLQIARMRARETGRYLLRATNTGITAIIAPDGRIDAQLPQFETAVLNGVVRPFGGATPYASLGNRPVLLLCAALVLIVIVRRRHENEG